MYILNASTSVSISLFPLLSPALLCLFTPHLINHKCDRRCNEVRLWACLGPGWWVGIVISWCSLLIWYGVWLRSLIRDNSLQRDTRLSITTRIPLARAKWDGGKGRGRRWKKTDHLERGWQWRRTDYSSVSIRAAWLSGEGKENREEESIRIL